MIAGLPYTALRDAIFTHPTMLEGLIPLFTNVPPPPPPSNFKIANPLAHPMAADAIKLCQTCST